MDKKPLMPVQLCYATPAHTLLLDITVAQEATIADAIRISGIQQHLPLDFSWDQHTGLFGKLCPLSTLLHPHDRIDICIALIADPKEAHRQRTEKIRQSS